MMLRVKNFYQAIINTECDGVLISGDIAEATCLVAILGMNQVILVQVFIVIIIFVSKKVLKS
jgi:hypothetical protein